MIQKHKNKKTKHALSGKKSLLTTKKEPSHRECVLPLFCVTKKYIFVDKKEGVFLYPESLQKHKNKKFIKQNRRQTPPHQ
jgi:hypothetical protein